MKNIIQKIMLIILMMLLTNCVRGCFEVYIPNYTIEEQQKLIEIIQKENEPVLNRFIIDYYNLRESLR